MVSPWYQHRNNTKGPTDTIWYHALSAVGATLEMLLEREREREEWGTAVQAGHLGVSPSV
jgi:hypothetical protein